VSAFGVSGTNAHVILEQVPRELVSVDGEPAGAGAGAGAGAEVEAEVEAGAGAGVTAEGAARPVPWVLSARSLPALLARAGDLAAHLDGQQAPPAARAGGTERPAGPGAVVPGSTPADVAAALLSTRALFAERAVIVGAGHDELGARLTAFADGMPTAGTVRGRADLSGRTVFVFPGQGAQWVGMAAALLESSPVFAARFDECEKALAPYIDWSPSAAVLGAQDGPDLERVDVVQPALWAMMISLAAVWESFGVRPDAVLGHSQGEIAAAVVAGALSLSDGARIVALRSRSLLSLAGRGGMAVVALPARQTADRLTDWPGRLSIAAVNGPASTVVAGERVALTEFVAALEARGIRAWIVAVDYASHSPQVEEVEQDLRAALASVRPRRPTVRFWSSVDGAWIDNTPLDADYWYRNLRQPVLFERSVRALADAGHSAFIEISPHPVLVPSLHETLDDREERAVAVGTLRRDDGGLERLAVSLAEVFVRGVKVDWSPLIGAAVPRRVTLPRYPFQRERYWLPRVSSHARVGLPPRGESAATGSRASDSLRRQLAGLDQRERAAHLVSFVQAEASAVLGHASSATVNADRTFAELGLSSLTAVELRTRVAQGAGLTLPATVAFDYPTPRALAGHLDEELTLAGDGPVASPLVSLAELTADAEALTGTDRAHLVGQLRDLVERLVSGDGAGGAAGAPDDPDGTGLPASDSAADDEMPQEIADASDEELFALIDSADSGQ